MQPREYYWEAMWTNVEVSRLDMTRFDRRDIRLTVSGKWEARMWGIDRQREVTFSRDWLKVDLQDTRELYKPDIGRKVLQRRMENDREIQ